MKKLGTFRDKVIDVDYDLINFDSAKEEGKKLKLTLVDLGIEWNDFNSGLNAINPIVNPPSEIYEYQNFFFLKRNDGKVILLDGFRRLLWYDAPDTPILGRMYNQKDLTDGQILSLLVNLNHFKFFGGGSYHERGFSLLLKTVFDVDITGFKKTFDAYLTSSVVKNDYYISSSDGNSKNVTLKDRIINPFFISDVKALEEMSKTDYLCDRFFGAMLYQRRVNSDVDFDLDKFLELAKEHKVLQTLTVKYQKIGTNNSAKSQDVVNKILEIYANLFTLIDGGDVEQSLAEKQQECKELVAKLKKDKTLTKLTGSQSCYLIERAIEQYLKKGKEVKFKCVIHPNDFSRRFSKEDIVEIPHGIIEDITFLRHQKKNLGGTEMVFGLKLDDDQIGIIRHNYGTWNTYGKKYTSLDFSGMPSTVYKIDLFVEIPKSEIPKNN